MAPSSTARSGGQQVNPFKCEHCQREFSTKGNLVRHVQAAHIGGQVFPCQTCGKEFKRKEDMHTHMRVHTGERELDRGGEE